MNVVDAVNMDLAEVADSKAVPKAGAAAPIIEALVIVDSAARTSLNPAQHCVRKWDFSEVPLSR